MTVELLANAKCFFTACLQRAVDVENREIASLLWSFAYLFSLLCAYFILRPLRDEMAIAGGVHALPWMFTGTFIAMLCVVPVFGAIVSRFERRKFIPYIYWFFICAILAFWLLFEWGGGGVYAARAFFIWTSVFNLFVVSVFWSFMVDLFKEAQGRRLFGFVAAGGTAGTIIGPLIILSASHLFDPHNLLIIAAALLVFSIFCVHRLLAVTERLNGGEQTIVRHKTGPDVPDKEIISRAVFSGLSEIIKSPYLIGIGVYIALFTWTSTFLYFQQANIIASSFESAAQRTQVFAGIDLSVSILTIFAQIFITGRFINKFGVGSAVTFLPVVTVFGFALFALVPGIAVVIGFQIIRRAANFAITRPGREMLFSVLNRDQKYKSKNFIDTAVYRGGDALSGWAFTGLNRGLGLDLASIALVCVPVAAIWAGLAWRLGQSQMMRARHLEQT